VYDECSHYDGAIHDECPHYECADLSPGHPVAATSIT
jgi:hypothetical protein